LPCDCQNNDGKAKNQRNCFTDEVDNAVNNTKRGKATGAVDCRAHFV